MQIVAALAGLMVLAFGPLFFAIASLTGASIRDAQEKVAQSLGRAAATDVADAMQGTDAIEAMKRILADRSRQDGFDAICAFAPDGSRLACDGPSHTVAAMPRSVARRAGWVRILGPGSRPEIEVGAPERSGFVVMRMRMKPGADYGAPLVRLVALYMMSFAVCLLLFAYFALTRLIVRPVEQLVAATDRVALGGRSLRVPLAGARELVELGASVQTMTDRLIAEEDALTLKVDELTRTAKELTLTQAQLVRSERLASVGRLAAGIAHELGNPIAALMGLEDLLLEGEPVATDRRDLLRRMRDETQRIHSVIRDLLDFARPEERASSVGVEGRPAVVSEVVSDVLALVRPQQSFRNIRVDFEVDASVHVSMTGPRLTQVLLNLLLNAGAAIASQSPTAGRIAIRAHLEAHLRQVRIEIEDDGPGIAAELRDRLFEPFVTTKAVGDGTGLGLAVCRGLVESAGGEIGIDWSCRTGALFYVLLPPAPAASTPVQADRATTGRPAS